MKTPLEIIRQELDSVCTADSIVAALAAHGYGFCQTVTTVHRDGEMRVM